MMNLKAEPSYRRDIRRYILAGSTVTFLLVAGIGGWSATAEISGAVIAPGRMVVVSDVKKVQHPTGGIVGEIFVKEGQLVEAGQPLLKLDDTTTRANLGVITTTLNELMARQSRLQSERDGRSSIAFVPELLGQAATPEISRMLDGERRLFSLRRTALDGNKAGLKERIAQLRQEISSLEEQIGSKTKELDFIASELEAARDLWQKQLVSLAKLNSLERESVRIEGLRSELSSRIAETRGRIAETELQMLQIDREFNSEVAGELRDVEGKIGELNERKIAAEDQLRRIDILAPATGVVHELNVHTVGGVVGPGEVLMLMVPANDDLEVEALVLPSDIDQLHVGAPARLRLSAFNQRTTPELEARLESVSADVAIDDRTGESHYKARVTIPKSEVDKLGDLHLLPGMPVEVFVKTSDRKVISLLLKPLTDQLNRAFRED